MLVLFYNIDFIGCDLFDESISPKYHDFSNPLIIKKIDIIPAKNSIIEIDNFLYKIVCVQHHTTFVNGNNINFYACYVTSISLESNIQPSFILEKILNPFLRKEKIKNLLE